MTTETEAPEAATNGAAVPSTHHLYEGMFLVDSGKFASDPDGMTEKILAIVTDAGGELVLHRPWSDGKLAYPIANQRKGLHYVVYFHMLPSGMDAIVRACRLSDVIMRQLVIKQPPRLFDAMVGALSGAGGDAEEEEE